MRATAQQFYDGAAERYRLERQSKELERQRAVAGQEGGAEPKTAGEVLGRQLSELDPRPAHPPVGGAGSRGQIAG